MLQIYRQEKIFFMLHSDRYLAAYFFFSSSITVAIAHLFEFNHHITVSGRQVDR